MREKHLSIRAFSCDICGMTFTRSNGRKEHIESIHFDEKSTCEICGKSMTKHYLRKHLKQKHAEEPSLPQCDICGKKLTSGRNLRYHKENGHGQRQITECPKCNSTLTKVYLERHMKSYCKS